MQGMEQAPEQSSTRFRPGQSGNPFGRLSNAARQERINAKARELAVELGGWAALSPVDRVMLEQASELLLRRPRSAEDRVRHANAVQRLLATVVKRRGRLGVSEAVRCQRLEEDKAALLIT
jgi:hypothetical protein